MNTKPDIEKMATDVLNNIQFSDVLDIDEIQRLQDLFADASGVASIITHPDGTPITNPSNFCRLCNSIIRKTEKGRANCFKSDAVIGNYSPSGPVIQSCLSGGLWDAGASISVGGKHLANWLIGQVRNEELDVKRMLNYADEIGANKDDFMQALNEVPIMSGEQLKKVSKMLFAFANEISEKAYYNLQLKMQIIEQEKSTKALQESEERYRLLIETAQEGILVAQGDKMKFVNPMMLELTGYTEEELTSRPFLEFVHPDDRELVRNNYLKQLEGDAVESRYHFRILKKDKSIKWFEINGDKIVWEDQSAILVFVTDITARKQAEEEIQLKNEQLLILVAEKDKFFSIIAHDLRNPLNTFLGLTQVLTEELPRLTLDKIQKFVVSMRNSASNLVRLLENLLHWARIQQGLIPYNPKIVRLLPFVEESIEMVQESVRNKEIEISYDIPYGMLIFADSNLLQTVFRNLISNALKFTHKEGKINLSAKETAGNRIEISIKDSGIGMSSTIVDNLFRLDVITNRVGTDGEPSAGLGLLLCKEIIEKLGGKLWVESEVGKGSNFHFTLPQPEL